MWYCIEPVGGKGSLGAEFWEGFGRPWGGLKWGLGHVVREWWR